MTEDNPRLPGELGALPGVGSSDPVRPRLRHGSKYSASSKGSLLQRPPEQCNEHNELSNRLWRCGHRYQRLAKEILNRGSSVVLFDAFLTGELAGSGAAGRKRFDLFMSAYNRTELQERVQDCVTVCAFAQAHNKGRLVLLGGVGRAGLWALLLHNAGKDFPTVLLRAAYAAAKAEKSYQEEENRLSDDRLAAWLAR